MTEPTFIRGDHLGFQALLRGGRLTNVMDHGDSDRAKYSKFVTEEEKRERRKTVVYVRAVKKSG